MMQIASWGNSLAVRLPKASVDRLGLKEGDDVELRAADDHALEIARAALRSLVAVVPRTVETHEGGPWLSERYRLPLYDAPIVSAALVAGCDTLWSEDMPHGLHD